MQQSEIDHILFCAREVQAEEEISSDVFVNIASHVIHPNSSTSKRAASSISASQGIMARILIASGVESDSLLK